MLAVSEPATNVPFVQVNVVDAVRLPFVTELVLLTVALAPLFPAGTE